MIGLRYSKVREGQESQIPRSYVQLIKTPGTIVNVESVRSSNPRFLTFKKSLSSDDPESA